jgi:hypothetical protein
MPRTVADYRGKYNGRPANPDPHAGRGVSPRRPHSRPSHINKLCFSSRPFRASSGVAAWCWLVDGLVMACTRGVWKGLKRPLLGVPWLFLTTWQGTLFLSIPNDQMPQMRPSPPQPEWQPPSLPQTPAPGLTACCVPPNVGTSANETLNSHNVSPAVSINTASS